MSTEGKQEPAPGTSRAPATSWISWGTAPAAAAEPATTETDREVRNPNCSIAIAQKQPKITNYFTHGSPEAQSVLDISCEMTDSHLLSDRSRAPGGHTLSRSCDRRTLVASRSHSAVINPLSCQNSGTSSLETSQIFSLDLTAATQRSTEADIHNNPTFRPISSTPKRKRASPPPPPLRRTRYETNDCENTLSVLKFLENLEQSPQKPPESTPKTQNEYNERVLEQISTLESIF